jgi:RCC1 and BTB domain-containing protein
MPTFVSYPVLNKLKPEFISDIKFFCIFGDDGNEVIIVSKDDKVFAFGDNKHGCLGLGHNNAVKEPEIVDELCDQQIIDISYGTYHVLALTKDGKCFSWGFNAYGQLGNGTEHDSYAPRFINGLNNNTIAQIKCGYWHTFVLSECGDLYGFGYNTDGEIGCGNTAHQLTPIKINGFDGKKIASIACGGGHSLALTESGSVYSWGWNPYGQLGVGNYKNELIPVKIILNDSQIVKTITCGYDHSLLLTIDGDVYAFGENRFGELGNGTNYNQTIPLKINERIKFKDIACYHSTHISVAKADNNHCYVWGQCESEAFFKPIETKLKSMHEIFSKYAKIKITYRPLHLNSNFSIESSLNNRILLNFLKLFDDQELSDIKFKIKDKYIYVHKLILKTNSNYFESKLKESESEVEIKEYSYDVYYAFLKYLYTDCVDIESEKVINLLVLANDYEEKDLKRKCIEIIKNNITIENVCSLYCCSIKYDLPELEKQCFDFSVNKMNQIFITDGFHKMDENSIKKFLERVAENHIF